MKKHLISLSDRQDAVLTQLAKELGISLSELVRRELDLCIENLVECGTLVRFTFTVGNKSADLEMPKEAYKTFYELIKNNPSAITINKNK
jgi:hypothetical protein